MCHKISVFRKRCRNIHDDDTSDFMPLSKRINNLHINNPFQAISYSTTEEHMSLKSTEWGPGPPIIPTEKQPFNNNIDTNIHSPGWNNNAPQYSPELSESENPYYYNNKLLFDLFVERMQRNGHSFN